MAEYIITLSNAEDKALHFIAVSGNDWIQNAVHERCRAAIDEIVRAEVERLLESGLPIPPSKDEIVLQANIKTAAERAAEFAAAAAAALPTQ